MCGVRAEDQEWSLENPRVGNRVEMEREGGGNPHRLLSGTLLASPAVGTQWDGGGRPGQYWTPPYGPHPCSLGVEGRLGGRLQLSLLPQRGETWPMPNCSQATCEGNNVITLGPRPCPHMPKPTCANGYPALKVPDQDGCCLHYQCQCEPGSPGGGRAGTRV